MTAVLPSDCTIAQIACCSCGLLANSELQAWKRIRCRDPAHMRGYKAASWRLDASLIGDSQSVLGLHADQKRACQEMATAEGPGCDRDLQGLEFGRTSSVSGRVQPELAQETCS